MNRQDTIRTELLVLRAQAGDADSLAQLVDVWQPRLWTFARVLTGNDETAWDVMQDVWVAVLRDLRRLQDPARFRPWVFRIVRNKSIDRVRQRQRHSEFLREHSADVDAQTAYEPHEIKELLAALPEQERSLLALHYLEGLAYEEMAAILEVPLGTVKSRLHAARKKLRERWEIQNGRP